MSEDNLRSKRRGRRFVAASVLSAMIAFPTVGAATAGTPAVSDASAASATEIGATSRQDSRDDRDRKAQRAGGVALLEASPARVHGVAEDGTEFVGRFKLKRFQERDGALVAVGRLTGHLGDDFVRRRAALPVTGAASEPTQAGFQPEPTPGACEILTLNLGPLDLNLLGLRVALDEVNLLIEAIPGAGNLLGNLLCAVAGLLDGGLPDLGDLLDNLIQAIADLLNGLLDLDA